MAEAKGWSVSGSYYESCNCEAVCPCRRLNGKPGGVGLAGRQVVMAGFYSDAEAGKPWSIKLFIDEQAAPEPYRELERIFLGKAGGNMPFTEPGRESIRVGELATSAVARRADYEGSISCGIPGHDRPGTEYVASGAVRDGPLQWEYEERCGFASDFHFHG